MPAMRADFLAIADSVLADGHRHHRSDRWDDLYGRAMGAGLPPNEQMVRSDVRRSRGCLL
jgi:hypothetical protein